LSEDVFNQYTTKHAGETIRVGHDIFLRWYVVKDKKWKMIEDGGTRQQAFDAVHKALHEGKECREALDWVLDKGTRSVVLGECPKCLNPALESDLRTYRRCPDCGWRIDFTPEQIAWLEKKLKAPER
jgi:hypothetical protein